MILPFPAAQQARAATPPHSKSPVSVSLTSKLSSSRTAPRPIKLDSLGHLTVVDCLEYVKELAQVVAKTFSAPILRQSHKDRPYQLLVWRCVAHCSIVKALAWMMAGAASSRWSNAVLEILGACAIVIIVTALSLQHEGAKLLMRGVGVRRMESLVALTTADIFWSDQDGSLTKKSLKTVRWDISASFAPFNKQELQDITALAMGLTGYKGIHKDRYTGLLQGMRLTPTAMPPLSGRIGKLVAARYLRNVDSGKTTFFAVADPCSCADYNALAPRLSTKGLQAMFASIGEVENARALQDIVRKFFKAGQACHVVVTGYPSLESPTERLKLQAVGVYPVHSPVLASARFAIHAIERHGLKFRLASAASQSYAHLVGGAIQTASRQLATAPLLEATPDMLLGNGAERARLVGKIINDHSGITRCGRLKGGKALLLKAAYEAGHSNVMFGDGVNDVEAMRVADVSIGAGLHSYWDVLLSADILVGTNASKQNISSLADLLEGAAAATSRVIRYLENVRATHQMFALIAVAVRLCCPCAGDWVARRQSDVCLLLPVISILCKQAAFSREELKLRTELTPWSWFTVSKAPTLTRTHARKCLDLLLRQCVAEASPHTLAQLRKRLRQ